MKTLKIGIAGYDRMKARTMAIVRGEHKPARGEPTVWFTSIESFAKVLSQRNRELLAMIGREKPGSSPSSRNSPGGASRTCRGHSRRCRATVWWSCRKGSAARWCRGSRTIRCGWMFR